MFDNVEAILSAFEGDARLSSAEFTKLDKKYQEELNVMREKLQQYRDKYNMPKEKKNEE